MKFSTAILISTFVLSALSFGCGDAGTNVNVANNASNSNTARANTNNPVAATTPAPEKTSNDAATLKPVFKAYCLAMEKKDEAGIRRVYSKDTLDAFAMQMKAEGSRSLVEFLSTDQVTTALCEIRNEVITGDAAVAEVRTAGMPNGVKVVFVKEGNDWKLTNRSPSLDAVKETAANSNSGK